MAVLGKRKARSEPSISKEDAAAIFRRHFEAQFAPLPGADAGSKSKTTKHDDEDEDATSVDSDEGDDYDEEGSEDDDEWSGFSDDEQNEVEEEEDQTSRKPESSKTPATTSSTLPEDAPSLLAQDLELRRLLAESHLLAPAINGAGHAVAPKAFDAGRTRNKATDLRIQALGSKMSIHKQEKMPMNMRKGIIAAADAREAKRRREAKENGVILERETGKKKGRRDRKRDFGVDRPGVGRLKGAELRLSDRDIRGIEGSRDAFGRRGRR
ncbi:pre-rRNA processing and 40S ribosomal subunit assembly [Fusarium piperis]|uniref:Pre-rRNA processing and 40S ribosomal subunit assembly n=1 Tax=Fusarium piperis TaxID=1435070 RepID=A0A9W8W4C1_9HYPO|nr:pre-rRNA processing and 40S ribosomal subunit assembly [Fusarium piperis]